MGKFKLVKKISLDQFGDDWKECYLSFVAPTYKEIRKIQKLDEKDEKSETFMSEFLKNSFIEGEAFNGESKVAVKADELEDFPMEIINLVIVSLMGTPSPN
jgi:hypothetical protein